MAAQDVARISAEEKRLGGMCEINALCDSDEQPLEPYDVYTADEAFMTGTPFCMLPVTKLNGLPIGNGQVGDGFKSLLSKWSENVGVDIQGQIRRWNAADESFDSEAPTPYRFKSK